jgi:PAS domain S-box-containing protein
MSPSKDLDEVLALRAKLAELEDVVQRQRERLQASEARFRQLAEAAPFMIWTAGSDGLTTYFNAAWLAFRGRRLDQETGNGWAEGLHPEDREACLENHLSSFTTRQPFRVQYRVMRSSGEYVLVENTGIPLWEPDGSFNGFMGVVHEVSDRKRGAPDGESMRLVFALTERERQVLVLIAGGKSTKEAAAHLGISYKTADSHRSRILEKLGVHETASMVRYAIRAGLIEP